MKVAVILASFYLLYALLLRRETWHRLNRAILLSSMALSLILPLCKITIHREAPLQPVAQQFQQPLSMPADISPAAVIPASDAPRTEEFTAPAYAQAPVEIVETEAAYLPDTQVTVNTPAVKHSISWLDILFAVWAIGVLLTLIRLTVSIISISNIIKRFSGVVSVDGLYLQFS